MRKLFVYALLMVIPTLAFSAGVTDRGEEEIEKIRIGVMPDAGALPLFLMEGVETVPFMSARERDTAMQLGELDGVTGDIVSLLSFRRQGVHQYILTVTESRFQIVGGVDFDEDGAWVVGVSENSVIEFMVDQLVPAAVRSSRFEKMGIPQVPVRLEMLRGGKIPLACLTDIMALSLPSQRFIAVRDQRDSDLEPAVLVLSERFLNTQPDAAQRMAREWNDAVRRINANPEAYRSLLYEQVRLPEESGYPVPVYRPVTLPSRKTVETVLDWFEGKYGAGERPSYDDIVLTINAEE